MANGLRTDAGPERVLHPQRLLAESLGTFLLVLSAAGAVVVDELSHGQIGRAAEITAPGLTVMAVILSLGALSGAHLNPVVTVAFALRGDFPWARVPGYVIAQLIGSVAACGLLRAMFGRVGGVGVTLPGPGVGGAQAVVLELVLTAGLIGVSLGLLHLGPGRLPRGPVTGDQRLQREGRQVRDAVDPSGDDRNGYRRSSTAEDDRHPEDDDADRQQMQGADAERVAREDRENADDDSDHGEDPSDHGVRSLPEVLKTVFPP